jgi:hypothetical protein
MLDISEPVGRAIDLGLTRPHPLSQPVADALERLGVSTQWDSGSPEKWSAALREGPPNDGWSLLGWINMRCPLTIMLSSAHEVAEALSRLGYVLIELPSLTDRILRVHKSKADALWGAKATTNLDYQALTAEEFWYATVS